MGEGDWMVREEGTMGDREPKKRHGGNSSPRGPEKMDRGHNAGSQSWPCSFRKIKQHLVEKEVKEQRVEKE